MRKSFDDLTIADDFMFCKVMQDEETCKTFLEMVLAGKIGKIAYLSSQNAIAGVADISGGTIKANHAAEGTFSSPPEDVGGGGICIEKGTVNFTGGTIKDNFLDGAKKNCGAGVFVEGGGTFNMTGGTIEGCKPDPDAYNPESSKGGGIYSKYQLTVSGYAQIKNNAAPDGKGGGIIIPHNGRFYFTGGTVSGNTAKQGRGIYISTTAAGIDPMEMSGSATVTEGNDVFLDNDNWSSTHIIVTKALTNTPAATLTMKNDTNGYAPDRVVVEGTNGPEGYKLKTADIEKFPITPQTSQNWTTELDTVNNKLKLKTTP
ncbi:right-handed parallel beta-helix repeat-containing protein [Treponema putidum]|uniref:right-handed parallel beta-helix repeat-containing protein n=1 Tax=Treponema putidum TaxID=221027 RepID=UPI00210822DA|nr:right-handed parallel beta-helix repeat-containing protein [Treponema putidum]UTY30348.1 hypothetical protein E4N75_01375 [Treponema putidum]